MQAITGLILAGGAGRRMGGVDKGLIEWHGRPLVDWVCQRLTPQVDTLMISANRHVERYRQWSETVLIDDALSAAEPYAGPLAGIAAGLAACRSPLLLCVPCDSPALPADLAARLSAALLAQGPQAPAALACCAGYRQPTFCLLRTALLPNLRAALAAGERKVSRWLDTCGAIPVDFPDSRAFANANSPDDLAALIPDELAAKW